MKELTGILRDYNDKHVTAEQQEAIMAEQSPGGSTCTFAALGCTRPPHMAVLLA